MLLFQVFFRDDACIVIRTVLLFGDRFISFVEELNRSMDIPAKLKVEAEDIPELSRHADKEANPLYPVPRLMNAAALEEIYYEIKK